MSDLNALLSGSGFKFKKSLGQNFITDVNLLRAIVSDSGADKNTTVIEIGAGAGTLTREIANSVKKVTAYEVDKSLAPVLENTLSGIENARIIYADILKTDIIEIEKQAEGEYIVIANLPYYITTPVIMYFVEKSTNCKSITVMVQKEVAQRLCAKAGTAEYGSITVAVDFYGGAKITRTVPASMFYPRPQVDSAVVKININENHIPVKDKQLFCRLYKSAFAMRRKTLANNISKSFGIHKSVSEQILLQAGLEKGIRGETLTAQQFALLSDKLKEYLCGIDNK